MSNQIIRGPPRSEGDGQSRSIWMVCDGKQAAVLAGYEHKNIPAACANFRHHQITYLLFCLFCIAAFDERQIAGQARELVFWNIPDGSGEGAIAGLGFTEA